MSSRDDYDSEGDELRPAKRRKLETNDTIRTFEAVRPSTSTSEPQSGARRVPSFYIGEKHESVASRCDDLCIGSIVGSVNSKSAGTVGPFVRIKESGDLCFLTVRHIFGPFQETKKFLGTKTALWNQNKESHICGEIIAAEYSESLDVVLVKVSETPSRVRFIPVSEENLRETGLHPAHISLHGNVYDSIDIRNLTSSQLENHRIIKVSTASGLTSGQLCLQNGRIASDTYTIKREGNNFMQIVTYENQLRVVPIGESVFAKKTDVGAAVYYVDENNRLHCIGMICRIMNDNQGVLITPIQNIIKNFEKRLGQTIEIVTFHSKWLGDYDKELFTRALREGKEQDRHLRVNIIGFYAQGKTTLTRRLLGESIEDIESTDGIDVHIRRCKMKENAWKKFETEQEFAELSHRLVTAAKMLESNIADPYFDDEDNDTLDLRSESYDNQQVSANNRKTDKLVEDEQSIYRKEDLIESSPAISAKQNVKSQQLFRHFSTEVNKQKTDVYDELIATIWDFGGQFVYYATHQIFHSRDAVYLLVFDLRKGLNNVLEDFDFPDRQERMKTSLMFWVNSINAFVGTNDGTKPKIILVGTHKDKFSGDIEVKFQAVKDLFAGTDVRKHIYEKTFAVSTVDPQDVIISDLRKTIFQIGQETALHKQIPAKWIPLEMSLLEQRHKNIITFEQVANTDANNDYPIADEDEIKTFLKYHHEKGTLVFFDEEELRNHVVLHPQFLIDAFRCIITSKTICDGSKRLHGLWKKMTGTAVLKKEIIDAVWSEENNPDFSRFYHILLNFLKRHRILAEIFKMEENSEKLIRMGKYMIPSFLKCNCPDETAESFLNDKTYSKTLLGISLKNNTVLAIVYERITAAALGRWAPVKFENQTLVFQSVGYYRLDTHYAGKIRKREDVGIELMVISLCPSRHDSAIVSDRFRRYCELVISQEFSKLHKDDRGKLYTNYIKCNHPDHKGTGSREKYDLDTFKSEAECCCPDYRNHTIDVKNTIDEWFQEKRIADEQTRVRPAKLITEIDLNKIAQAIGTNWELLGIALGLSSDKIERTKQYHRDSGTATVIFYMLREWKNQNPTNADQRVLMKAIRDTNVLSVNWDKIGNFLDNF